MIKKIPKDHHLDDILFDTVGEINSYFTTLPSFGSMLPYRRFDERFKVFVLGDAAKKERYAGAMWEYVPFIHEANSLDGQKLAIANLVETALLQIPEGYAFQFITVSKGSDLTIDILIFFLNYFDYFFNFFFQPIPFS